ncbi:MAG: hypothetical protein HYX68_05310 [Planctomycetes bacterium]|jgi:hypothetical protein|nr:hypothetical protein [Planctomycetota bacterium]
MSWLIDNANSLYILLAIVAAGFVVAWRFDQRVKYLGYAAGVLALLGLFWLVTQFVTTDAKQIKDNVKAMADAVVAGKVDDVFQHVSRDFKYKDLTREALYELVRDAMKAGEVSGIRITKYETLEISRAKKVATVRFNGNVTSPQIEHAHPFTLQLTFVLEGEQWKLKTLKRYKYFVDTDREIDLLSPQ